MMRTKKTLTKSEAKFYGLREIPFEPTGIATGKYPYVAPDSFDLIEERIKEVISEKKLYVLLLRAPQGGGKSAAAGEISKRLKSGKYKVRKSAIVTNKLINLDVYNYVQDFLREASKFLPENVRKLSKINRNSTLSEMKNVMAGVLTHMGENNNLTIWIIDEFDILVDYPKEEQSQFLQFVREVVDEIVNQRFPMLFVMAHTMKSSKEFEEHLKGVHGPFQSRIVDAIEIGYRYDEVRRIVVARMHAATIKKHKKDSIWPFTEESLKALYRFVVNVGGTGELTNFRLFERVCYFCILDGSKKKLKELNDNHIRLIFEKIYKTEIATGGPAEDFSLKTRVDIGEILRAPALVKNESILRGLERGMGLMSDLFKEITNISTDHCGTLPPGINLSCLSFSATLRSQKQVSAIWFLSSKEPGMIVDEDAGKIDHEIGKVLGAKKQFANIVLCSYVSNIDLAKSNFANCDEVLRIPYDDVLDLIGLGVCTEEDMEKLRKSFDSDIAPSLREIFLKRIRDVSHPVPKAAYRLVKSLAISQYAGSKLTKDSLRETDKFLQASPTKPKERLVADLIDVGFASEESGKLSLSQPKSVKNLLETLNGKSTELDEISKIFGEAHKHIIDAAENLGIIKREMSTIRPVLPAESLSEIEKPLNQLKAYVKDHSIQRTYAGKRAMQILSAIEEAEAADDDYAKIIVYKAASELLPSIISSLGTQAKQVPPEMEKGVAEPEYGRRKKEEEEREPEKVIKEIVEPPGKFEDMVKKCLKENTALTLEQLADKIEKMGFEEDVRQRILGMVMQNKLKISL